MGINEIKQKLASFAEARNWDQFHTPKNLSMALAAEAAELLEIFQWLTDEQSKEIVHNEKETAQVRQEIADVMIYLVRLADKLNVNIEQAVLEKIELNEKKYPIEFSKDNAIKYNKRAQNSVDQPKSLRDPLEVKSRLSRLFDPHVSSLTLFVETVRRESGLEREIPYFDPLDGGINAKCLFLFEAPGPRAVRSGFISRNNPDESAKNFFELNTKAEIPREITISWNIVPWYLGNGKKIRAAKRNDIEQGKIYLLRLLALLPNLSVIVLGGRNSQQAESFIKVHYPAMTIIKMPHPSPLYINNSPENRFHILRCLEQVKDLLFENTGDTSLIFRTGD